MSPRLKYADTTVEATKSAGQIGDLVRKYGGSRFEVQWSESGMLTGVRFALRHPTLGEVPVRLLARTDRIVELLRRGERGREQAYRIAWRQLRDFVEQALFAVETKLFPIHEVFMAQTEVYDHDSGETITFGELLERRGGRTAGGALQLRAGPPVVDATFRLE